MTSDVASACDSVTFRMLTQAWESLYLTRPSGGWSSLLSISFGVLNQTKTHGVSLSRFCLGTPRFTLARLGRCTIPRPRCASASNIQSQLNSIATDKYGRPAGPARSLVTNPWTDHTSIFRFFSHRVERWMSSIFGKSVPIFPVRSLISP